MAEISRRRAQQRADIRQTVRVTTNSSSSGRKSGQIKLETNENETASAMKIRVHVKLEKVVSQFPALVFLLNFFGCNPYGKMWKTQSVGEWTRCCCCRRCCCSRADFAAAAVSLLISALFVGALCQMPGVDFSLMKRGNWKAATKRKSERTFSLSVRPTVCALFSILFLYAAQLPKVFFFLLFLSL